MTWKPHVTVSGIVTRDDRYLMVVEESDAGLVLNQPAGHWEDNETLSDAIIREVQEETAWLVEPLGITGVYHWRKDATRTFLRFNFHCRPIKEFTGQKLDHGIVEATWLTLDEIQAQQARWRNPYIAECIADQRSGKNIPLDFIHSLFD